MRGDALGSMIYQMGMLGRRSMVPRHLNPQTILCKRGIVGRRGKRGGSGPLFDGEYFILHVYIALRLEQLNLVSG